MFLLHYPGYFKTLLSCCILLFLAVSVGADTPANCTYEDAHGRWLFEICSPPNNCSGHAKEKQVMDLLYPNLVDVVSGYGNDGYWTLIYNQGFEVTVAHRKWLVMFAFGPDGESFCDRGIPAWSHDSLLRQWRWFTARKVGTSQRRIVHKSKVGNTAGVDLDQFYRADFSFINLINSVQNSWTATHYPELERYTLRELRRRTGGDKSAFPKPLNLKQPTPSPELLLATEHLPEEFDWRYPPGGQQSPVTPVRDQSSCGSCYAFASAAALEARVRIWSNFTRLPTLSPQDVVDCSPYSEVTVGSSDQYVLWTNCLDVLTEELDVDGAFLRHIEKPLLNEMDFYAMFIASLVENQCYRVIISAITWHGCVDFMLLWLIDQKVSLYSTTLPKTPRSPETRDDVNLRPKDPDSAEPPELRFIPLRLEPLECRRVFYRIVLTSDYDAHRNTATGLLKSWRHDFGVTLFSLPWETCVGLAACLQQSSTRIAPQLRKPGQTMAGFTCGAVPSYSWSSAAR